MSVISNYYNPQRIQGGGEVLKPNIVLLKKFDYKSKAVALPIIVPGKLIVNSNSIDNILTSCFDEAGFDVLWNSSPDEFSVTPVVCDDRLYVNGGDDFEGDELYTSVIDIQTGDRVLELPDLLSIDQCISNFSLYVQAFFPGVNKEMHLLCANIEDFSEKWRIGDRGFDCFSVSDEFLVLKDQGGKIVCINPGDGSSLWEVNAVDTGIFSSQEEVDGLPTEIYSDHVVKRMNRMLGYPCIYSNKVIVSSMYGNNIIGLDAETGKTLWVAHLEYTMCTRLQAYGDEIYSSGGRYIEAHDMASGERTKLIEIDQDSYANATGDRSPAMSDFTLSETHVFGFKTSPDPIFYSVNKENGAVEWTYKPDKPIRDADHPYICNGRIYYRTLGGLYIFEGADGYLGT